MSGKSDKREQIIDAGVTLFARDGLSVPTATIAKEAGVSNGTLFNYFATKQNLIDEIFLTIREEMAASIFQGVSFEQDIRPLFHDVWRAYIFWARENPLRHQLHGLLQISQMLSEEASEEADQLFDNLYDTLEDGIAKGQIADIPSAYVYDIAVAQIGKAIAFAQKEKMSSEKLENHIEMSFEIFWKGIQA